MRTTKPKLHVVLVGRPAFDIVTPLGGEVVVSVAGNIINACRALRIAGGRWGLQIIIDVVAFVGTRDKAEVEAAIYAAGGRPQLILVPGGRTRTVEYTQELDKSWTIVKGHDSFEVGPHDIRRLFSRLRAIAKDSDAESAPINAVLFSGSLYLGMPASVVTRVLRYGRLIGASTGLDVPEEVIQLLYGPNVPVGRRVLPDWIMVNNGERKTLFGGEPSDTDPDRLRLARKYLPQTLLLAGLGSKGLFVHAPGEGAWRGKLRKDKRPPEVVQVGRGDSRAGAWLACLLAGKSIVEAIAYIVATMFANTSSETAGELSVEDAIGIDGDVTVTEVLEQVGQNDAA